MLNCATSALLFASRLGTKAKSSPPARRTKPATSGRELDEEEERKAGRRKRKESQPPKKDEGEEEKMEEVSPGLFQRQVQKWRERFEQFEKKRRERASSKQAAWESRKAMHLKLLKAEKFLNELNTEEHSGLQRADEINAEIRSTEEEEYSTYLKWRRSLRMTLFALLVLPLLFIYYLRKWRRRKKEAESVAQVEVEPVVEVKPIEKPIAVDDTFSLKDQQQQRHSNVPDMSKEEEVLPSNKAP